MKIHRRGLRWEKKGKGFHTSKLNNFISSSFRRMASAFKDSCSCNCCNSVWVEAASCAFAWAWKESKWSHPITLIEQKLRNQIHKPEKFKKMVAKMQNVSAKIMHKSKSRKIPSTINQYICCLDRTFSHKRAFSKSPGSNSQALFHQ